MEGAVKFVVGATFFAASFIPGPWSFAAPYLQYAGLGLMADAVGSLFMPAEQGRVLSNQANTLAEVPVVYGTAKVGLRLVDVRTYGSDNERLLVAGAVCHGSRDGGDISELGDIYFNEEFAVAAGTGGTGAGIGTTGIQSHWSGKMSYNRRLGSTTQTVPDHLSTNFPTVWNAGHEGKGVAWFALYAEYDEEVWSGIPNITIEVEGNRVYDLRDSTWKFTDNPALCIYDYLVSDVYGAGIDPAELDTQSFIDAANFCDQVPDPTNWPGKKRFTCNGVVNTGRPIAEIVGALLSSCRGELPYFNGQFHLLIRDVKAAETLELTEAEIVGDWSWTMPGIDSYPNLGRASYIDANFEPQQVEWPEPEITNTLLAEDNGFPSPMDISLPFTNDPVIAMWMLQVVVREARQGLRVTVRTKEEALKLALHDVVQFTHEDPAFDQKEFRVLHIAPDMDATVLLTCQEYEAAVYSLDNVQIPPTSPNTSLPDLLTVPTPTGLTVTTGVDALLELADGTVREGLKIVWDAPTYPYLHRTELQAKKTTDSVWRDLPHVPAGSDPIAYFYEVAVGEDWDIRARHRSVIYRVSAWATVSGTTVTGKTAGPDPPSGLQAALVGDRWTLWWTPPSDLDIAAYEVRYVTGSGGSWAGGTTVQGLAGRRMLLNPLPKIAVESRDLPNGIVTLLVKSINGSGVPSSTAASIEILNFPGPADEELYGADQKRKRPGGDSIARWGAQYDLTGITKLFDEQGVLVGLTYDDPDGNPVNVLRPIEGAAQRNFETVVTSLTHGQTYSAPAGKTIRGAKYRSGGLSVQGASLWGTEAEVDAGTANDSPPATYAQAPAFDLDGASMEARLLLKERLAVTYADRTEAFLDNSLTFAGDETGLAEPAVGLLPAHDGMYRTTVTGQITSDKAGTYQIRVSLKTKTNGGSFVQKDEQTIEGNLNDLQISRVLSAFISGWPSGGTDQAKVVVEDVIAAGNWSLSLSAGALTWVQASGGSPAYASMTPNGESCEIEVTLEAAS